MKIKVANNITKYTQYTDIFIQDDKKTTYIDEWVIK